MARSTSIESFRRIKDEGLLPRLQLSVYEHLFDHGPLTAKQLDMSLGRGAQATGAITTRLSELRAMGVVFEVGKVRCEFTGRTVILWDCTDKLPVKVEKLKRHKCPTCKGRGYLQEEQAVLPLD